MKVTKIAMTPGFAGLVRETHALEQDNVEVLLIGETREWETVEYAADAVTEGKRKAVPSLSATSEANKRHGRMYSLAKDVYHRHVPSNSFQPNSPSGCHRNRNAGCLLAYWALEIPTDLPEANFRSQNPHP